MNILKKTIFLNKKKDKYQKEIGVLILFKPDDFIWLPIDYLEWKKLLEDMRKGVGDLCERDQFYGFDWWDFDDDDEDYENQEDEDDDEEFDDCGVRYDFPYSSRFFHPDKSTHWYDFPFGNEG